MSFSCKQYALALPQSLDILNSLILVEKTLKIAKLHTEKEIDDIFTENLPAGKAGIDKNVKNLIKILIRENKINVFNKIFNEYKKILFENKQAASGIVITSFELKSDIKTIENEASRFFKMPVILENKIDKTLIGGAIIKVEDWQIDNSFSTKLKKIGC